MPPAQQTSQRLTAGERLSREEFLRRWESMPELKRAELIEGVVYLSSPVSRAHGFFDTVAASWLAHYTWSTPGCQAGSNGTWLMLEDAPQPDSYLLILPEYGGQCGIEGLYWQGAPELVVETSFSSASRDFGPKLRLYRKAGVREYISLLVEEAQVVWRELVKGDYAMLQPDADGLLRSAVFPGLWLDPQALWSQNMPRLLEVLNQGLAAPEHEAFVRDLARKGS